MSMRGNVKFPFPIKDRTATEELTGEQRGELLSMIGSTAVSTVRAEPAK